MKKVVLFASGSGSNVENIVLTLKSDKNIVFEGVYCNNPNAFVIERCAKLNLPCTVFSRDDFYNNGKVLKELLQVQPDLVVLAGFLWLIPADLIQSFSDRIINIHPALLPKYGGKGMYGMNVHKAVVENGEKESGITIHYVNEKYDEGNIIYQESCEVTPEDKPEDVASKVHALEYEHFPAIIHQLLQNK